MLAACATGRGSATFRNSGASTARVPLSSRKFARTSHVQVCRVLSYIAFFEFFAFLLVTDFYDTVLFTVFKRFYRNVFSHSVFASSKCSILVNILMSVFYVLILVF